LRSAAQTELGVLGKGRRKRAAERDGKRAEGDAASAAKLDQTRPHEGSFRPPVSR
jgi:hypothetical protein